MNWQVIRWKILKRDNNTCQYKTKHGYVKCGKRLIVHHMIPITDGGTNELSNLQTLCYTHHTITHNEFARLKEYGRDNESYDEMFDRVMLNDNSVSDYR